MDPNSKTHLDRAIFIVVVLVVFIPTSLSASQKAYDPTVYEILPKYGLPSGLLPDSVTNYTLSNEGHFTVVLKKNCYVQFEYLVYYDTTISGKLGYGSITDLKGIQVQRFLLWFDVDEIRVDLPPNGSIYFHVGVINKKLDLDQFQTVHSCSDRISGPCVESTERIFQVLLKLPTNYLIYFSLFCSIFSS